MKIPSIKITYDLNKEVDLFLKFLHHHYYPQHKFIIFKSFPELEILLKTEKNKNKEKTIIKEFIKDFYKKNDKKIKKIIVQSKKILKEKEKKALIKLAKLMDYQWPKNHPDYTAMPTILPFSPFGNNVFYFSILEQIKRKGGRDILFIAIHEISHFILFNFLKKLKRKKVPEDFKNYFKETLTAVLLNQKPLNKILKLKNYQGNPEIRDLQIKKSDGVIISFTEFINEYYQIIKIKNKKTFKTFLQEILNILLPINKDFSKKRAVWNRYGNQLYKKPHILLKYQKPIQIKKR